VAAAAAQAQDARKGVRPAELAIYDANVAAAEARTRDAEAVLRRVRTLERQGIYAPARLDDAKSAYDAAAARLSDIAPTAPGPARVEDVFFQNGEGAVANQPILALLPDDRIKLRFFVPETAVSAYGPGKTVRFSCDGCAAGLTAKITYVSPRPEFTPPVIYSREARDRLVYLVEARPSVRLNPGLPVDVTPLGPGR
jgi:HlyD family secretion protein